LKNTGLGYSKGKSGFDSKYETKTVIGCLLRRLQL